MPTSPPADIVLFRADAGERIGTGHVMRCLVIADALAETGLRTGFICKAHKGHLGDVITQRGHPVHLLDLTPDAPPPGPRDRATAGWLGGSVEDDARQSRAAMDGPARSDAGTRVLVVDHYELARDYHRLMRPHVAKLLSIEDLPDRRLDCDLLIDQNFGHTPDFYDGRVPAHTRRLVGARYAPLRAAFADLREAALLRRQDVVRPTRILISVGGTDPDDVTTRITDAFVGVAEIERVDIVLSSVARHLTAVRDRLAQLDDPRFRLHVDTPHMPELMRDADLAIGAGGVTALERCVLGLPTLMISVAANQDETVARFERHGASITIRPTTGAVKDAWRSLMTSPTRLMDMARQAAAVCDGRGLSRIVPEILDATSAR